jgi:hypothetical protein
MYLNIPEVVHGSVINGNAYTNGARGFTYTRQQAGYYIITFSAPLASAPDYVADIINPPVGVVAYCDTMNTILSSHGVAIACWSFRPPANGWTVDDRDFTFMCSL